MHRLINSRSRNLAIRVGMLAPAVLLSACQVVAPQAAPPARLLPNQSSVSVAGVTSTRSSPNPSLSTFTVKRDTLRDSMALTGKVVPARSSQLTFRGNGTVTAVHVQPGQVVDQGDTLAEFAPDDVSLQAARAQATLADLSYQAEQAKLNELQAGTNKDSIQQMRVVVERDQAEIQKLEQDQAAVEAGNGRADEARAANNAQLDRKVSQAEAALQAAKDNVTKATADVKQAQEDAQAAADKVTADREQSIAEANSAAAVASSAVRAGQHAVDQATIKLAQAKAEPATTRANQQIESQQLRVDQETDALKDAKAVVDATSGQTSSADHTARQIAAEVASATANARSLDRTLAADKLELKHMLKNLEAAKEADAGDIREAAYALDAVKEQLVGLQLAEQQAKQKATTLAKPVPSATPPRANLQSITVAQAALKQAEDNVRSATVALEDAQAAQAAAQSATETRAQFADRTLRAAQAQLSADQAKLNVLQSGTSATELARQQARVSVLRDQATAAAEAAQPIVPLKAPFKGTVSDVMMKDGQAVGVGASGPDGVASDTRQPSIRLIGAGPSSIVADASESDVGQLARGQTLDLNFPGLPGQVAQGRIVDIGSTATVKDNQVSYPIQIDMTVAPAAVKYGMTVQASLSITQAQNVLVAPRRAIRTSGGQTVVDRIAADGQLTETPVQVGRTSGTNVELVNGVQEGEVVAVYDGVTAAPKQP